MSIDIVGARRRGPSPPANRYRVLQTICIRVYIYIYIHISIMLMIINIVIISSGIIVVNRLPDGVGTNVVFTEGPRIPYMLQYVAYIFP